jgi:ABC-type transport system involved in cytochrome bd biosynthesis fused ATPase/permease subunit
MKIAHYSLKKNILMIRKKESIEKLNQYWDQNNVKQIIDNGNFKHYLKIIVK